MITLPFCLSFLARVINEHRAVQNLLLGMINSKHFKSRTIILYHLPWHVIYIRVNTCISIHNHTYVYNIHKYKLTDVHVHVHYTQIHTHTYTDCYGLQGHPYHCFPTGSNYIYLFVSHRPTHYTCLITQRFCLLLYYSIQDNLFQSLQINLAILQSSCAVSCGPSKCSTSTATGQL